MQRSMSTGKPWFRLVIMVCLLFAGVTNSGCATTLGYIPEHPKPIADTTTITPTYGEVKKWAYDVLDGYDSRATINRNAIYGGALIAAAAVGAIAGLAAFDTGSSALIGIPIGTTFLGSVAAIYSSEEKAHIYRLASEYVKDLITISDKRMVRRRLAAQGTAVVLKEAQDAEKAAQKHLDDAKAEETAQQAQAKKARTDAENAAAESNEKAALTKSAQALDQEVAKIADTVAKASVSLRAAKERVAYAAKRDNAWNELKSAQAANDQPRVKAAEAVWAEFSEFSKFQEAEALCLREDVSDVMRRVVEHKALLDPKNIAERLKSVRASDTKSKSETASTGGGTTTPVTPGDLSNLMAPVRSSCDNAL